MQDGESSPSRSSVLVAIKRAILVNRNMYVYIADEGSIKNSSRLKPPTLRPFFPSPTIEDRNEPLESKKKKFKVESAHPFLTSHSG